MTARPPAVLFLSALFLTITIVIPSGVEGQPVPSPTSSPAPSPAASPSPSAPPATLRSVLDHLSFTPPDGWLAYPLTPRVGVSRALGIWASNPLAFQAGPKISLSAFPYGGTLGDLVADSVREAKAAASYGEEVGEPSFERHCGLTQAALIRVVGPYTRRLDSMAIIVEGVAYVAKYERSGPDDPVATAALQTLCRHVEGKLT